MRFNGERSLREWSGHLDDQVQRLVALQREMILLSRRLGPHEHRLLLELVDLHDRLWSLTDMFKSRLVTSPSVKASQQEKYQLSLHCLCVGISRRANENNPSPSLGSSANLAFARPFCIFQVRL
ncbi:hypothetical protein D918_08424 [Trichuris suis]|nr:hypothetical protein D918_08424 [Trichuris suis]